MVYPSTGQFFYRLKQVCQLAFVPAMGTIFSKEELEGSREDSIKSPFL